MLNWLLISTSIDYNNIMAHYSEKLSSLVLTDNMDMKKHSSFSTGGCAEYYAEPRNVYDCLTVLEVAYQKGLCVTVIGAGTHLLVSDTGIPGLVISTASMKGMTIKGNLVITAPGEALDNVINQAIDHNLIGLEEIAGIPGTIAGAVSVNASANDKSISDFFLYADYISKDGHIHRRPCFHDYFKKQKSAFRSDEMIISIALRLTPSRASAEARVRKEQYVEKMYIPPCRRFSGEIFRDSPEMRADTAIRIAGLTGPNGMKAEFSEYQPNSIVTYPGCTSREIYTLIENGRNEVKAKLGIDLDLSLTLLGDFQN